MTKSTDSRGKTPSASAPQSAGRRAWLFARSMIGPIIAFLIIQAVLLQAFKIPSGSMENTLLVGDWLFANKALYGAEIPLIGKKLPAIREPARNDIVIFESVEEPGLLVVKRIVGTPGDTLSMVNGILHLNGEPLDEPWAVVGGASDDHQDPRFHWQLARVPETMEPVQSPPTLRNWGPLVIPEDSLFAMGDNRPSSYDSRYWGFLGRDRLRGAPLIIYYSYNRNGLMPLPALTAIRWDRIFSIPQ